MAAPGAKLWVIIAVSEVIFGVVVFAATREYYRQNPAALGVTEESRPANTAANSSLAGSTVNIDTTASLQDPAEISRQADTFFANGQYAQAAAGYQRLLLFSPGSAQILNNLGLTQHYLGKYAEALATLRQGIAADASNQRLWLTFGFVNSQLGNVDEAREALEKTIAIGGDASVSASAREMLDELP